jgi:hypothetical protein
VSFSSDSALAARSRDGAGAPRALLVTPSATPAVEIEGPADQGRVCAEPAAPEVVGEHHVRSRSGHEVVLGGEGPPAEGRNSEDREEVAAHQPAGHPLLVAGQVAAEREAAGAAGGVEAAEHPVALAQLAVHRHREEVGAQRAVKERAGPGRVADREQPLRLRDR